MARRQLEVSNEVAAELAGSRDAALRTLEEHLDCEVFLRGNIVTLDGEAEAVQAGATVIRELSALVERGHDIGPATIESVARVLESAESPSRCSRTSCGATATCGSRRSRSTRSATWTRSGARR